ncbi:MAG: hypothetical protein ACREOO_04315 [bacterium]
MAKIIVSDTGPMISLEKLSDGFEFIRKLYTKIIIPEAVLEELASDSFPDPAEYLHFHLINDLVEVRPVLTISDISEIHRLDKGEKQAISLAYQLSLPLLIEETIGRQIATSAALQISGIAGQIMKAFKENLITSEEATYKLKELFDLGRINFKIYNSLSSALK